MTKLQHLSKANQKAVWFRLTYLCKHVDMMNVAEVEKYVYAHACKNNYKNKLFEAYERFCIANEIVYKKPKKLKEEGFVINVPTEQRIDTVIACSGWVYATVFNLSKYGLRPDEIAKLTLRNIDLEVGKINVPTSKLGAQRTVQLKKQIAEMLREYVNRKRVRTLDEKLFGAPCKIKGNWRKYRRRAYEKFHDVEFLKIRLYDLRHWFATMTYVKTRDIFYVKYILGHRRLENTLIYIHLSKSLVDFPEDYVCEAAKNVDEAKKLIESGFEYVTEFDNVRLFRKRK